MKVTIHCEGTPKEIGAQLIAAAKVYGAGTPAPASVEPAAEEEETDNISIADIKKKRGRKAKPAEPEETEEEETTEEESEVDPDDEGGEESEEEDFEEEEEEEESEEEEDKLSDADLSKLKGALKNYSAKHDKKKAVTILNKFAKRSDLVKPADLPKLMKLLKV